MRIRWWMISAAVVGALMVAFGIGDLVDPENTGPQSGQLALLATMAGGAVLIAYGLTLLRRGEVRGGRFVGVGVLPGSVGLALFWFPPAVAAGALAIVTSVFAFRFGGEREGEAAVS